MAIYGVDLPEKVQLYWHCQYCGADHYWPQEKAKLFCDAKCRAAAEYLRKKNKSSELEV